MTKVKMMIMKALNGLMIMNPYLIKQCRLYRPAIILCVMWHFVLHSVHCGHMDHGMSSMILVVQVGFENSSYLVAEDAGSVSVCVNITGQLVRELNCSDTLYC